MNKVDRSGWTALFYALSSEHNRHECVRTLLNSGADVNKVDRNSNTALTIAAHYGDYEALMMLLKAGADVNVGVLCMLLSREIEEQCSKVLVRIYIY